MANVTERDGNEAAGGLDRLQEKLWVLQAQSGDPEAFHALVSRYERRLFYYIMRFDQNPEHAADLLQEVWLTVFRGLKNLRAPEAFRVWVYQITHDKIVTAIRREVRQEEAHEAIIDEGREDFDAPDSLFSRAELLHHALGSVSADHREVLTLRFLEDLSLEEIAEALRCPLGTVKSRLHHAKQSLRKILEAKIND